MKKYSMIYILKQNLIPYLALIVAYFSGPSFTK